MKFLKLIAASTAALVKKIPALWVIWLHVKIEVLDFKIARERPNCILADNGRMTALKDAHKKLNDEIDLIKGWPSGRLRLIKS